MDEIDAREIRIKGIATSASAVFLEKGNKLIQGKKKKLGKETRKQRIV